jgi:hypothetical protein
LLDPQLLYGFFNLEINSNSVYLSQYIMTYMLPCVVYRSERFENNWHKQFVSLYIYIYIYREREREREIVHKATAMNQTRSSYICSWIEEEWCLHALQKVSMESGFKIQYCHYCSLQSSWNNLQLRIL